MLKTIRKKPDPFRNLRKVNNIDPGKYSVIIFDHSPIKYDPDGTIEERVRVKIAYCNFFGCGKILTMEEKLCGSRCVQHPKKCRDIFNNLSI